MARTLKEDLQDDLQVLVDLIQHSCKPHPRPPRAGMKTLIVQGRILAEAIAQDALFQLDPSDPSAPRPDRDLVDLINRLRDHHPNSLLAPALHVLRSLGNTAVHLDRDSARLTDAEIGDAAAVVCRFVVLVVDAYMQMCANLHKHEEKKDALAQPLEEAPVATIPAPNVLLRPRESAAAANEPAAPTPLAHLLLSGVRATSASYTNTGGAVGGGPGVASAPVSGGRSSSEGGDDGQPTGGARRQSGGSAGGRRSHGGGSAEDAARVPYSLVPNDWAAPQPHLPAPLAATVAGGSSCGLAADRGAGGSPSSRVPSRGWWPPLPQGEAAALAAVPAPPPLPLSLLRRPPAGQPEAAGLGVAEPHGPYHPPQAAALTNWLLGHPAPDTNSLATGLPNGTTAGGGSSGATPSTFDRTSLLSQPLHHPPYDPAAGAPAAPCTLPAASFTTVGLPLQHASTASASPLSDRSGHGGSTHVAGGSPRRSPLYLVAGLGYNAGGGSDTIDAAGGILLRGSSPQPLRPHNPHGASAGALHPTSQQQLPYPRQALQSQPQGAGLGGGAGAAPAGSGAGTGIGGSEASKRLLQLCAVAQAPPAAKVQQLLKAGATLAVTDKSGMTALHMACYWCHKEAARLLLERHPSGVTLLDREGRSPLWVASQRGHVELVELLLSELGAAEASASVNAANASSVTPLRVAAAQGHTDVVEVLLQAGADTDSSDKDGFTPLYVACARSHLEVVRLLLAARAPPDKADKGQRTPLWAALHPGGAAKAEAAPDRRAAVVRALLSSGADVHLLPDVRDRDYCWQLLAQSIAAGE